MKTVFRVGKGMWFLLLWLSAGIFLYCGCAGVRPLSEKEISAIQKHDRSLVLLRAVWHENGTNGPVPISRLPLEFWQLGNGAGEMLVSPQHRRVRWIAPFEAALKEGWVYAVLPPGNYYVQAPLRVVGSEHEFHLSVPGNGIVCYGGSLLFSRTSGKAGPSYGYLTTSNEVELATAVASDAWREFSGVSSAAMISYRTPPAESLTGFKNMIAVGPTSAAKATVEGDNNSAEGLCIRTGAFLLGAGTHGPGEGAVYLMGAGLALMVAGIPIDLVTDGTVAGIHHFQWKPYVVLLKEQVRNSNLTKQVLDSMNRRLGELSAGTNKQNPSIALQIQPCRILLRGHSKQKFNLEMAVRVRLLNTATKSVLWDNTYVHSTYVHPRIFDGDGDSALLEPFEQAIQPAAISHPLEDYKGPAGKELLAQEFNTAAEELGVAIADSFSQRTE